MSTSSYIQVTPPPLSYTILWGKQISMSDLDTSHRKISITPEDKYLDQLLLILLARKKTVSNQQH